MPSNSNRLLASLSTDDFGFAGAIPRIRDPRAANESRKTQQVLKFVQAFGVQTTHTAICNAQYRLDARLARWLLMAHDRIGGDTLQLTHEFLSIMLGVRRPGVTEALHALRERGLISYGRGQIAVKDRKGLEHAAGEAYGTPEAEYRRLMGEA